MNKEKINQICALIILLVPTQGFSEDLIRAESLIELLGSSETTEPQTAFNATRGVDLKRGIGGIREGGSKAETVGRSSLQSPQQSFSNVLFGVNSADLKKNSYRQLNEIGKALQQLLASNINLTFTIEGHTDNRGSQAHNKQLSLQRALSVRAYLTRHFNLQENQLDVIGLGESQPITNNDTPTHRSYNRRVVISRNK